MKTFKTKLYLPLFYCILTSITMQAQTFNKDVFKTKEGKELSIYFIKHSSLILSFDNQLIYVDPVSMFADFGQQPKADIILITHEHADHFDPKAIEALKKETTSIVLNESTQEKLETGTSVRNGEKIQLRDYLQLEAVPAYNTTPGREMYHPKDRDNGYILTIEGLRIYIAGDTEDIPEMEQIKDIDVAFLPVNQPYTMTVEQAIHAAKMIQPKILYPYHYNDTKVEEIKEYFSKNNPKIDVRIRQLQ